MGTADVAFEVMVMVECEGGDSGDGRRYRDDEGGRRRVLL